MNLKIRVINAFALVSMFIMAAAVGIASYIFLLRAFWIWLENGSRP